MSNRWQFITNSSELDPSESLLTAASAGSLDWVLYHLDNGADVNMRSSDGWTPLLEAAAADPEITRLLLEAGADHQLHSKMHYTPLMRAAGFENFQVVKLLTEAGADLFARDDKAQTALDMAIEVNNLEICAYLQEMMLQAGLQKSKYQPSFGASFTAQVVSATPQSTTIQSDAIGMNAFRAGLSTQLDSGEKNISTQVNDQRPRSVPIFLSSTFRDMHAERDYLRDFVFPELEERLKERGIQIEPIDLRFGIETVSLTEEQEKSLHVLKTCLAEIQRSRPFFLCLIGDRYGWILPERDLGNAIREAGNSQGVGQISVTELEIDFGLDNETGAQRGLVFLRDPLPYDQLLSDGLISSEEAARFSDLHGDAENVYAHNKLINLKSRLKNKNPRIVHTYSAKWNANTHRLSGLEEWGQQVIKLLWAELDEETADWAQKIAEWQVNEGVILNRHWENHRMQFAGRYKELEELLSFGMDHNNSYWATLITSPEGYGKSAMLAMASYELERRGVWILSHSVGLTPRSFSIESMQRRFVHELAKRLDEKVELPELCDLEQVTETFWSLLRQAGVTHQVALLIDNIDQFMRANNPQQDTMSLGWLSQNWPKNVRLIASSSDGLTAQLLRDRPGVVEISLGELEFEARDQIVQAVCDRYHRDLGQEVRENLIGRTGTNGFVASSHPQWLILATEVINLLDADDFHRTECEFSGSADERIHQLLLHTVHSLPTDLHGIYLWILQRARDLHGKALTDEFVKLTAVSRYGLRESDYRILLPKLTDQPWDSLRFAMLRRTFRSLVHHREDDSRCDFAQQQIRNMILRHFFAEISDQRQLHAKVAVYLRSLPTNDPIRQQETMYHLVQVRDALTAARYLCECAYESKNKGGDPASGISAIHILAENVREQREPFLDWITSWLELEELDTESRIMLAGLLGQVLDVLLMDSVDLTLRRRMHDSIRCHLSTIVTSQITDNPDIDCQLLGNHKFIGSILLAEGKGDQALLEFQKGYRLANELVCLHPDRIDFKHNLSLITISLATLFIDNGLATKAKPYFDELVRLEREITKIETNDRNFKSLASALAMLGNACFVLRLMAEAKIYFQEALDIIKQPRLHDQNLFGDISEHMGNLASAEGRLNDAVGFYKDVISIRENGLAATPNNRSKHLRLCIAYKNLGGVYLKLKELEKCGNLYQQGLILVKRMESIDPTNTAWQHESAVLNARLARVNIEQQQFTNAISLLNESISILDLLIQLNPGNAQWHGDLLGTLVSIGDTHIKQKCYTQAVDIFTRCISVAKKRLMLDPENPTARREMALAHAKVGGAYLSAKNFHMAREPFEKAVDLAERNRQILPDDVLFLEDCVGYLWNLGRVCQELHDNMAFKKCLQFCKDYLKLIQIKGFTLNNQLLQIWDILSDI